jgi:23S rRNA pseudouridine1911/1915/1917 synthase
MTEESFLVPTESAGARLDKVIAEMVPELSRSAAQKLIAEGAVVLNGKTAGKSDKVKPEDEITVNVPDPVELAAVPQEIPLDIVYEDGDLLVVNKPKGMVVHPAPGNPDGTLVNALLWHCKGSLSGVGGVIRPGIVHRIDKDTSGLLAVAKNDFAHAGLSAQIKAHSFRREYRAVVVGHMPEAQGTVSYPLGRSRTDRKKQAVNGINAREAVTHYEVLTRYQGYDLCRFVLETGRTHQIRVHMAYIGHPLLGDGLYGAPCPEKGLEGQCLHASALHFKHPRSGEDIVLNVPLPEYFQAVLSKLGNPVE